MTLFSGTVSVCTNTTAAPRPIAVLTVLLQARNEHMPRKKASAMFSRNIERMAMSR